MILFILLFFNYYRLCLFFWWVTLWLDIFLFNLYLFCWLFLFNFYLIRRLLNEIKLLRFLILFVFYTFLLLLFLYLWFICGLNFSIFLFTFFINDRRLLLFKHGFNLFYAHLILRAYSCPTLTILVATCPKISILNEQIICLAIRSTNPI